MAGLCGGSDGHVCVAPQAGRELQHSTPGQAGIEPGPFAKKNCTEALIFRSRVGRGTGLWRQS